MRLENLHHVWTSHVTYEEAMSHMHEACPIWMSHVIYECVGWCVWRIGRVFGANALCRWVFWMLCPPVYIYQHNALQHTAAHCNTLQHTATHCNTLQHIATHWIATARSSRADDFSDSYVRRYIRINTMHCNTLQRTTTHCNTPQHTATLCISYNAIASCKWLVVWIVCPPVYMYQHNARQHTATHCNKCNALQHTATHCNTLQHAATYCNTLNCYCTIASFKWLFWFLCPPVYMYSTMHCNTLQQIATHCKTLHDTATHF